MMRGYGYGPGFGHVFGPGPGLIGGFFTLLLIAAIVVLVIALLRHRGVLHAGHPGALLLPGRSAATDEALAIAQRRFANGEITRDQYEEIRDTLTPTAPTAPNAPMS